MQNKIREYKVTDREAETYAHSFVTGIQNTIFSSLNLNANQNQDELSINNEKWAIHSNLSRKDEHKKSSGFQTNCFDRLESSCYVNLTKSSQLEAGKDTTYPGKIGRTAESQYFKSKELTDRKMVSSSSFFNEQSSQSRSPEFLETRFSSDNCDNSSLRLTQHQEKSGAYGKKCPVCHEINDKDSNWCIECGKAIVSVEIRRYNSAGEPQTISYSPTFQSSASLPTWKMSYSPPEAFQNQYFVEDRHFSSCGINSLMEDMKISCHGSLNADDQIFQNQRYLPNSKSSLSFDFDNPQFDDFCESQEAEEYCKHHAVYRRSSNGGSKSKEKEDFYPFDDLLYPDFAIYDPNLGYALPSSNIVSNGFYLDQKPYQTNHNGTHIFENMAPSVGQNQANLPKKKNSNKKKKRKQNKSNQTVHPVKSHLYSSEDFIKDDNLYTPSTLSYPQKKEDECHWKLPDEIILYIFSFLPMKDIVSCLRVCKNFNKIANDTELWREISIKKNSQMNDSVLGKIARRQPVSLTLTKCNGKDVSTDGLRHLFKMCSESLQKLDISYCHGGALIGETLLLHAAVRCKNIKMLDVSWTNVSNASVQSISQASKRFEKLCLNGCQAITDETLIEIVSKHGDSLKELEVLGCFKISFLSTNAVSERCKQLTKLNVGQCHKITNVALTTIAKNLMNLEVLDIRGCKQIKDVSMKDVATNCHNLKTIILANCPLITDATLLYIADNLPKLECVDLCGCGRITDRGVSTLAKGCRNIKALDLSSTKVTYKSVTVVGNSCRYSLTSLKLSFCHSITDQCLRNVVHKCKKLQTLHLYGCKPLRYLSKLMEINPTLKIERESLR